MTSSLQRAHGLRASPGVATWGVLLLTPALAIGGAYAWLAIETARWVPWNVVVHEDGRRTLAQTVLYPRHFLREVPVLLYYVAALAVAVPPSRRAPRVLPVWAPWCAAAALVGLALAVVVWQHGLAVAAADVGQYFRRDDEGQPGVHWGSHGLSNVIFVGLAWLAASPWRGADAGRSRAGILLAVAGLASLCLVPSPFEAVFSPRAAGHQVREVMTHAVITLPLGLACLVSGIAPTSGAGRTPVIAWFPAFLILAGLAGLSVLTLLGNALADPSAPWSARLAAHVFEHAFDYGLVVLVCLAIRRPV